MYCFWERFLGPTGPHMPWHAIDQVDALEITEVWSELSAIFRDLPGLVNIRKNMEHHHAIFMGKPWENHWEMMIYMERSTMLLMGKLTISTGPLSIAFCMFTRDWCHKHQRLVITLWFLSFFRTELKKRMRTHCDWHRELINSAAVFGADLAADVRRGKPQTVLLTCAAMLLKERVSPAERCNQWVWNPIANQQSWSH